MFSAEKNFDTNVKWYVGQGCMNCGRNISESGNILGYQCIDLGVDEFDGRLGLCTDCAREVGRLAGMFSINEVESRAQQAADALSQAIVLANESARDRAAAKIDRDVVERLMNLVMSNPDDQPSTR